MDFDEVPEEAAFRAEVHAWLSEHAQLPFRQSAAVGSQASLHCWCSHE